MRHLLLLFILLVLGYGLWHIAGRRQLRQLTQHLLRIAAIGMVLLALLVLAYHFSAIKLL